MSQTGPLAGCILGLTVETKLTAKEQKPGLAVRRESVSLCQVLGGYPRKWYHQLMLFALSVTNLVQVTESGGHEKLSEFSRKAKVVFPTRRATAKSGKGKCDLSKHQKAEDLPLPP